MATQIGKLYAIIGLNTAEFDRKMKSIGQKMTKVGKTLTKRLTLPLIALGAIAIKVGADFEQSMANAASVCGATGEELDRMKEIAREMGMTTVYSAKEAGDAMYYMASAGWDVDKMAQAIKPTLALAAATQSELAFTTNTVVSTLNQFRLDVSDTEKVVDIYANAIANSQATLDKLGVSMSYVGPIAKTMGLDLKDTTSILMGLYNAGYDASKAGTALRMGFAKLMKGTTETKEALARLGLQLKDVDPSMHDFADIVDLIRSRGADAKDILEIFGVRAGPAMAALIGMGGDALREFRGKLDETGTAARMQEIQIRTLKGTIKLLTSALSEVAIQIFDIVGPAIKKFIDDKIRPAVKWFSSLSRETKKLLIGFAAFLALIGPSIMLFGKLATAMATASAATKVWAATILLAYGAYKGLLALREKWEKATGRWVDREKQAWDAILEKVGGINGILESAVKAHVISQKQHHELWEKFKLDGTSSAEDIRDAIRALAEGEEGAKLAEFLKELGGAELEVAMNADVGKASLGELKEAISNVNEIIDDAIKKGQEEANNVKELIAAKMKREEMERAIASTVKEMTDQIKQATLSEYKYRIWKAEETYKERKALLDKEEADAKAYVLLEKSRSVELDGIEKDKTEKFIEHQKTKAEAIGTAFNNMREKYLKFKDFVAGHMDALKQLTMDRYEYEREKTDKEHANALEELRKYYEKALISHEEYVAAKKVIDERYAEEQKELEAEMILSNEEMLATMFKNWEGLVNEVSQLVMNFVGVLNAMFRQQYENRMIEIDNEEKRRWEALSAELKASKNAIDEEYETRKKAIEDNIKDADERAEKLKELEEWRADEEKKIEDKQREFEEEMEQKRKDARIEAAKHAKLVNIAQAIMNVAQAITKTLASVPFPFNIPLGIAMAALGAKYVAAIQSQPLPMKKGGITKEKIIAELHPGELVTPLEKLPEILSQYLLPKVRPQQATSSVGPGREVKIINTFNINALDSADVENFIHEKAIPILQDSFKKERAFVHPNAVREYE